MQADIAIVIAAYNRPLSLKRLLKSVAIANYEPHTNIHLIISVDHSGSGDCAAVAAAFEWKAGKKDVLLHPVNRGLKEHILACGDLGKNHDAIILLEDDLLVSPEFYQYSQQAYRFFKEADKVAGIALYQPRFNETALCPFEPIDDGFDNYFMQVPCSWGQMWSNKQWQNFRTYLHNHPGVSEANQLPGNVQLWPDASSWKKLFYGYLLSQDLYFVYPRIALSTNFGEAGQHINEGQLAFQTPLLTGAKDFRFSAFENSRSVYDGYFEPAKSMYKKWLNSEMPVTFDLNGTKSLRSISTEFMISCRYSTAAIQYFSAACYPYELNILFNIEAESGTQPCFSLAKTSSFTEEKGFNRVGLDARRTFMNINFVKDGIFAELKRMKEFRIGKSILQPIRYVKNIFTNRHG